METYEENPSQIDSSHVMNPTRHRPSDGWKSNLVNGTSKSVDTKLVVTDEFQRVFKSFDANGDGKISVSELGNMLKALGSSVSADELQRVMGDLDTDRDDFTCLDEFNAFWVSGSRDGNAAELRDAFDLYDQDRNGLISANELHLVLNQLQMTCSLEDCNRMIKSGDV
ncbi:hypothetical protein PRUPE_7G023700 [Prunus persica]|uniref:EF-hand domain-containing protein n=1 Tax=Prunus persica TaxID=3760 RepID=A0A251N5N9_PRUPE|nr:hypothetical protein PRUPE_7G023700 [Prunus persica]